MTEARRSELAPTLGWRNRVGFSLALLALVVAGVGVALIWLLGVEDSPVTAIEGPLDGDDLPPEIAALVHVQPVYDDARPFYPAVPKEPGPVTWDGAENPPGDRHRWDPHWVSETPDGDAMLYHEVHSGRIWVARTGGEWYRATKDWFGDGDSNVDAVAILDDQLLVASYEGVFLVDLP